MFKVNDTCLGRGRMLVHVVKSSGKLFYPLKHTEALRSTLAIRVSGRRVFAQWKRYKIRTKEKSATGLEPAVSRFVGGRLIRWATQTYCSTASFLSTIHSQTTQSPFMESMSSAVHIPFGFISLARIVFAPCVYNIHGYTSWRWRIALSAWDIIIHVKFG